MIIVLVNFKCISEEMKWNAFWRGKMHLSFGLQVVNGNPVDVFKGLTTAAQQPSNAVVFNLGALKKL